MAWLCIDAGTSLIKAVLLDSDGRELAVSRQSVPIARPQSNHAEQDMVTVWQAVINSAREITRQSPAEVEGIVTTAQGDGCWLVDDAGDPVGPAILWNDSRASDIVAQWYRPGLIEAAFRHSGSVSYPGLANALLQWLQEHDPDRLARARWLLSCNGWLYLQLTGEVSVDLSDASNPFCDVVERKYSPELMRLYGAEAHLRLLPENVVAAIARSRPSPACRRHAGRKARHSRCHGTLRHRHDSDWLRLRQSRRRVRHSGHNDLSGNDYRRSRPQWPSRRNHGRLE